MTLRERSERWRHGAPEEDVVNHPSSPGPHVAALLRLQRSAGNSAVARLVDQTQRTLLLRWSVAAIDEQREAYQSKMGAKWNDVTLHHTISRARMKSIAVWLQVDLKDEDTDVASAARDFWNAAKAAVGSEVLE